MQWGSQAGRRGWEAYAELWALAYMPFSIRAHGCSLEWRSGTLYWCTVFKILWMCFLTGQCLCLKIPGAHQYWLLLILVAVSQSWKSRAVKPREQHHNTSAGGKVRGRVTYGWTFQCHPPVSAQTAVAQKSWEREIILLSVSCAGSFPSWLVRGLAEEWWRRSTFEFTCISPHFHRLCWSPGCCSITLERMTSICFSVPALTPICHFICFFLGDFLAGPT